MFRKNVFCEDMPGNTLHWVFNFCMEFLLIRFFNDIFLMSSKCFQDIFTACKLFSEKKTHFKYL